MGPQPLLLYARQTSVVPWCVGQGVSLSYPLQMMTMMVPEEGEDGEPPTFPHLVTPRQTLLLLGWLE